MGGRAASGWRAGGLVEKQKTEEFYNTKLPRTTLGTGLARTGAANTGTPREPPPKRLPRGLRGALSSVHSPAPATGKLIHNLLCDCRVKNDRDTLLLQPQPILGGPSHLIGVLAGFVSEISPFHFHM